MTLYMAVKIHYDHRSRLPPYLKYSDIPRGREYQEYLDLYRQGVGGEGFDECLNFKKVEGEPVRIYLPPGYRPANTRLDEEFVIFSFTYQGYREFSSHIVGIHAGVQVLSLDGILRRNDQQIQGADPPLNYHAEAPRELTTLLNPPLRYDFRQGLYTPIYSRWSNGLRYINEGNARRIVDDALRFATDLLPTLGAAERVTAEAQLGIMESIKERYFDEATGDQTQTASTVRHFSTPPLPDAELGFLGEQAVYNDELQYVRAEGISEREVQWVSQAAPYSPFDIRTVRKVGTRWKETFLEVKSTKIENFTNVFISLNQVHFFETHDGNSIFKFVIFGEDRKVREIKEFSLCALRERFEFVPIEYKLSPK